MATRNRRLKNFRLDPVKIKRAQRALCADTETQTVERPLDSVISEYERDCLAATAHGVSVRNGIEIKDFYGVLRSK